MNAPGRPRSQWGLRGISRRPGRGRGMAGACDKVGNGPACGQELVRVSRVQSCEGGPGGGARPFGSSHEEKDPFKSHLKATLE